MPLEYDIDTYVEDLEIIQDEYLGWLLRLTSCIFYPESALPDYNLSPPDSFTLWLERAQSSKEGFETQKLKNIKDLHKALTDRASILTRYAVRSGEIPASDVFEGFNQTFENFMRNIKRLSRESLFEGSGFDSLTGLRNQDVLKKDIAKELDRLSREGKPFSLALVRIDDFEGILKQQGETTGNEYIKLVAELIKKCVRSFDDAYRIEDGMFILSLKQTSPSGGILALNRLKREVEDQDSTFQIQGRPVTLSLSSCVAEPLPDDDIDLLLKNLKSDLSGGADHEGTVLEYNEMSPLERYVKEAQE